MSATKATLHKHRAFSPPNTWFVLFGGRTVVQDETLTVASAVCDALNYPERWAPTEAYEIADTIHRSPIEQLPQSYTP